MPYLLDTDWIIQALTNHPHTVVTLNRLAHFGIAISLISIGEVYEGAFRSSNPQEHLKSFRQFATPFHILNLNDDIMEQLAEIRAFLRRHGKLIPDFDILLGATSLHYDLTLLTYNVQHFDRIPDLRIYRSS